MIFLLKIVQPFHYRGYKNIVSHKAHDKLSNKEYSFPKSPYVSQPIVNVLYSPLMNLVLAIFSKQDVQQHIIWIKLCLEYLIYCLNAVKVQCLFGGWDQTIFKICLWFLYVNHQSLLQILQKCLMQLVWNCWYYWIFIISWVEHWICQNYTYSCLNILR